jgi:hypothetical protein
VREESGVSDQESGHQSESSDQDSMSDFIVNDVEPGTRLDWRKAIARTHRKDRAAEKQWLTDAADAIVLDSTVRVLGQSEMRAEGAQEEADSDSDEAANFVGAPKKKCTR